MLASDVPGWFREQRTRYAALLGRAGDDPRMRERPAPEVWSALEYLCHVRDVLEVQHDRLQHALHEPTPTFSPMGREDRVLADRYNEQDPPVVLAVLDDNCRRLAAAFLELDPSQWDRTGIYNWPSPTERTMLWLAQHTIHELVHHLEDISTVLAGDRPGV